MTFILVSLKKEIEYFLDIFKKIKKGKVSKYTVYSGRMNEKEVTVIKTGIGRKPLDPAVFKGCSRIISTGFCGALVPDLKAGDIVVSKEVMLAETGFLDSLFKGGDRAASSGEQPMPVRDRQAPFSEQPTPFDEKALLKNPEAESIFCKVSDSFQNAAFKMHAGRTVTASRAIRNYKEKVRLGRAAGAVSVDMEDFYRMETAKGLGVPSVSIRTVLDEVHDEIPGFRSGLHFHSSLSALLSRLPPAKMNLALVLEKILLV